jgi:zinc transport system permease protein
MALLAALIGAGASIGGLALSLWQDTPAGPSIVACAAMVFAVSAMVGPLRRA